MQSFHESGGRDTQKAADTHEVVDRERGVSVEARVQVFLVHVGGLCDRRQRVGGDECGDVSRYSSLGVGVHTDRLSVCTDTRKPVWICGVSLLTLQMPKVGSMLIPDSVINRATSAVLKGVMLESELQQKSWAEKSGISPVTLQKLLSGNQSVKVPQLLALAHASKFTPEEIMERIDRAIARAVSEEGGNVTHIRPKRSPEDGAQEDFNGEAQAAHRR